MTKQRLVVATVLSIAAVIFIIQRPAQTQVQPRVTATRDAATTATTGDLLTDPGVAMVAGTRGSSSVNGVFRARALVACDQHKSRDLSGPGGFGLTSEAGKRVYVCSYSISNGGTARDVQFVHGSEASSGSGTVCNPGHPVTAKFHLAPNQFVSQGSGVGVLFMAPQSEGLCLKVFGGAGDVSVNVTYATF